MPLEINDSFEHLIVEPVSQYFMMDWVLTSFMCDFPLLNDDKQQVNLIDGDYMTADELYDYFNSYCVEENNRKHIKIKMLDIEDAGFEEGEDFFLRYKIDHPEANQIFEIDIPEYKKEELEEIINGMKQNQQEVIYGN